MPEVLYLQADNSSKDNKNNFLLAFLASLVKEKVFKKVTLFISSKNCKQIKL